MSAKIMRRRSSMYARIDVIFKQTLTAPLHPSENTRIMWGLAIVLVDRMAGCP